MIRRIYHTILTILLLPIGLLALIGTLAIIGAALILDELEYGGTDNPDPTKQEKALIETSTPLVYNKD